MNRLSRTLARRLARRLALRLILCGLLGLLLPAGLFARGGRETALEAGVPAPEAGALAPELPAPELRRVALFASGVGYFEFRGSFRGPVLFSLSFPAGDVNDVLKSLVIRDPASASPSVTYPSEDTVYRSLRSLRVDLSGEQALGEILGSLRGEELEVYAPERIRGRILGVEYVQGYSGGGPFTGAAWLSLYTGEGIRQIWLADMERLYFTDPLTRADFERALDLLMERRSGDSRELRISLPGEAEREVSLSYVAAAPVWKVSYRLDLSGDRPYFQGWAIIDNGSDRDWADVELSLIAGRPVSFIQELYPPYYVGRPVEPLAIAGSAAAQTYDTGAEAAEQAKAPARNSTLTVESAMDMSYAPAAAGTAAAPQPAPLAAAVPATAGNGLNTAAGEALAEQFAFTLPGRVSIPRHQSAMLPLVSAGLDAEKFLVFSGSRAQAAGGRSIHPAIAAEITNTTGMSLPAGPITVYEGGLYAGDALIEFLSGGEKRLISWGEDLAVSGSLASSSSRTLSSVSLSGGVMTISRKLIYQWEYSLSNKAAGAKRLLIEHPVTGGAALAEPALFRERTSSLYRFALDLEAGEDRVFRVQEELPLSERVSLGSLRLESLLSYAANGELPAPVRAALSQAAELRRKADNATAAVAELEARRTALAAEQDRIRRNLEAAGNTTPQGQDYLRRMAAQDTELDELAAQITAAAQEARAAREAYDAYTGSLSL
ncbi:MAG: DUF4139 domain-containing protein [Treponema sp.]|nr:DUF4139 domain-containing protein [Treponema sp.]